MSLKILTRIVHYRNIIKLALVAALMALGIVFSSTVTHAAKEEAPDTDVAF